MAHAQAREEAGDQEFRQVLMLLQNVARVQGFVADPQVALLTEVIEHLCTIQAGVGRGSDGRLHRLFQDKKLLWNTVRPLFEAAVHTTKTVLDRQTKILDLVDSPKVVRRLEEEIRKGIITFLM